MSRRRVWEEQIYKDGELHDTVYWDSLDAFWAHVEEAARREGITNDQLRANWRYRGGNKASSHYVDGAGSDWALLFNYVRDTRARFNPKDPDEIIPVMLFWEHPTITAYLRVGKERVWGQLRHLLGDIPDFREGGNIYRQPRRTVPLQFRRKPPEKHVGRAVEILAPRWVVGSVMGTSWEPGKKDPAYEQYQAFQRWEKQATKKLQDKGLLSKSRRNPMHRPLRYEIDYTIDRNVGSSMRPSWKRESDGTAYFPSAEEVRRWWNNFASGTGAASRTGYS